MKSGQSESEIPRLGSSQKAEKVGKSTSAKASTSRRERGKRSPEERLQLLEKLKKELTIEFIDYEGDSSAITKLRRSVFQKEQGFGEMLVYSSFDSDGIHLGAFHKGELVSCVSAYILRGHEEIFHQYALPKPNRLAIQYTKRAEHIDYRHLRLNEYLSGLIGKIVYEVVRPDIVFLWTMGVHRELVRYYRRRFGFRIFGEIENEEGHALVLVSEGNKLVEHYQKAKKVVSALSHRYNIHTPSLINFLRKKNPQIITTDQVYREENLYASVLQLRDELPRLSSQASLIFQEQKQHFHKVDLPKSPAKFLDAGCGPGNYTMRLSRHTFFKDYEIYGIDNCEEYIEYAGLLYKNISWINSSVYEIDFEDSFFDMVHASILLIHLTNADLAVQEFSRILKPGGLLYIVDINDNTFKGAPVIKRMIEKHSEYYIGNREIMEELPQIASEHDLALEQTFSTTFSNTGIEGEPVVGDGQAKVGRNLMWGLFSFIGQKPKMAELYQKAQVYYFKKITEISIDLQTHIYRKQPPKRS